nr:uncharacterized protein LOC109160798 [Ipomoea trifida]
MLVLKYSFILWLDSEVSKVNRSETNMAASVEMGNMSRGSGDRVDMIPDRLPDGKPEDWIEYFKFKYSRDTASDARNALLVVAALLVQVTYQAGINPPDYIFMNNAGTLSYAIFLMANTLSLSAAMVMIEYLTANMPYQREMRISMFCMMFGYGFAAGSTKPSKATTIVLLLCSMLPYLFRTVPYVFKRFCY